MHLAVLEVVETIFDGLGLDSNRSLLSRYVRREDRIRLSRVNHDPIEDDSVDRIRIDRFVRPDEGDGVVDLVHVSDVEPVHLEHTDRRPRWNRQNQERGSGHRRAKGSKRPERRVRCHSPDLRATAGGARGRPPFPPNLM